MAKAKVAYLVFDVETAADAELVAKIRYPYDDLDSTDAVTRYRKELLETNGTDCLKGLDAILVPGGFGSRGIEGKIAAANYARTNQIPYLGICLGMQVAVIEYARNILGLKKAHSSEFNPKTPDPVIALISEWLDQGI